jgi:type IV pilus assembly protein PilX
MQNMKMLRTDPRSYRAQRGSVLIVGLILLLVMTMLGLSNISGTTLQEKMAGNTRDRAISFSVAETALRDAENAAQNSNVAIYTSNTAGYYDIESNPAPLPDTGWSGQMIAGPIQVDVPIPGGGTQRVEANRRIEKQPNMPGPSLDIPAAHDIEVFKTAASSTGPSGTAEVVLETSYRR